MYGSIQPPSDPSIGGGSGSRSTSNSNNSTPSEYALGKPQFYIAGILAALLVAVLTYTSAGNTPLQSSPIMASVVRPDVTSGAVSKRGGEVKAIRDDLPLFMKAVQDAYHPTDNPNGYLVMLVAENKLMWKEMAQKIEKVQSSGPLPSWIFNYGDMGGQADFKQSMANMMRHWIHAPIDKDYLRFQDGAGSVLAQISYILTDPGDAVLTPSPGYVAFDGDFGLYAGAKLHWVSSDATNRYVPTRQQLDDAYDTAMAAGNIPRIFVICQPHNPTGVVFSKQEMEFMLHWALDKGLHVVSDEIYALSTFPGYNTTSAADILWENNPHLDRFLGDRVHIVAGLSKDWGMSGFRVGSLLTHNLQLLNALDTIGYYQSVPGYIQYALTGVFEDKDFVSWYIQENQRRLHETYLALKEALDSIQVPLFPSQGAIFAWADFSAYILEGQSEKDLWMELFNDAKIALTSGESCKANKPGMFRIVYGWPEGGTLAMEEFRNRLVQWKARREANLERYK